MRNKLFALASIWAGYHVYKALRPRYDFRGKHVVITGGSRGLGLVMGRQFAQAGALLSICSRDLDQLARAEEDLSSLGATVLADVCDVTDREQVARFLNLARERNGAIDVLINNAGVIHVGPSEVMTEADYESSIRSHFWAAYNTIEDVLPEMKARQTGRIVNISSIGGKIAIPHLLPYSVGKFALAGYSEGLRTEVARHGVVVTTVYPGLMRTGSHLNAQFKGRNDEEYAWFAAGDTLPVISMSAEAASRKIVTACARGDAEVVLGLPTQMALAIRSLAPNLVADTLAFANGLMPLDTGGIGTAIASGRESRGKLPSVVTTVIDSAALRNNEGPLNNSPDTATPIEGKTAPQVSG